MNRLFLKRTQKCSYLSFLKMKARDSRIKKESQENHLEYTKDKKNNLLFPFIIKK